MVTAITYSELGDPGVLTVSNVDAPILTPETVLVRVEAAGVNPIDAKLRSGIRPGAAITSPRRVGFDGAGVVTAVGDQVEGFRVGDEVAIFGASGVYAEEISASPSSLSPRPAAVSAPVAAAVGVPAGTAYQALRSLDVTAHDTLLIHAGSGSVGQFAIQYAVLWGAKVIATASPRRFDRIRELGATPVAYGPGLEERIREAAPDGITVALDAAGTDEALDVSATLVPAERIATIVRGADAAGRGIHAYSGGSPTPLTDQQQAWRAEAVPVTLALLAAGAFRIELAEEIPLADAARAHRLLEDGADGKIVLIP